MCLEVYDLQEACILFLTLARSKKKPNPIQPIFRENTYMQNPPGALILVSKNLLFFFSFFDAEKLPDSTEADLT